MKKIYFLTLFLFAFTSFVFAEDLLILPSMTSEEIGDILQNKTKSTSEKIRLLVAERGKDIMILGRGITSFGQKGREEWAKSIISFSNEFNEYPLIRIINSRGVEELKVVYGREIKSGYADVSQEDFFKESIKLEKEQISVSNLLRNSEGVIVLRMSTPIYGLSGMDKVILSFDWDIQQITNLIKKLKMSDISFGFVIDPTGKIMIHPDKEKMLKEKLSEEGSADYKEIVQRMQLGESGWGNYSIQGEEYIIGFTFYPELDWSIGISYMRTREGVEIKDETSRAAEENSTTASIKPPDTETGKEEVKITPPPVNTAVPESKQEVLSPLSLKILKGALRAKNIQNYKATVSIEGKISPEITERMTVRLSADGLIENLWKNYQESPQQILNLWDLNENFFSKYHFEITSPELISELKLLNNDEAFIYKPLGKKLIKCNREEFIEYQKLTSPQDKMFSMLHPAMIDNYSNDKIDIQAENGRMFYFLEMESKTPLEFSGISLVRIKMKIEIEYFMPVLVEWFDAKGEKYVTLKLEEYNINTTLDDSFSYTPKADDIIVPYAEIKQQLLKETEPEVAKEKTEMQQFNFPEMKNLLQEEIKKRAMIAARILAAGSDNFILDKNIDGFKNVVLSVWKEDWVDYILILDSEGKKVLQTILKDKNKKGKEMELRYQTDEISVPILYEGRPVGSIKIGVNLEKADYILNEIWKKEKIEPAQEEPHGSQ